MSTMPQNPTPPLETATLTGTLARLPNGVDPHAAIVSPVEIKVEDLLMRRVNEYRAAYVAWLANPGNEQANADHTAAAISLALTLNIEINVKLIHHDPTVVDMSKDFAAARARGEIALLCDEVATLRARAERAEAKLNARRSR